MNSDKIQLRCKKCDNIEYESMTPRSYHKNTLYPKCPRCKATEMEIINRKEIELLAIKRFTVYNFHLGTLYQRG